MLCVTAMQRNAECKTQQKKEQLLDAEKRRNATQREKRIAPRFSSRVPNDQKPFLSSRSVAIELALRRRTNTWFGQWVCSICLHRRFYSQNEHVPVAGSDSHNALVLSTVNLFCQTALVQRKTGSFPLVFTVDRRNSCFHDLGKTRVVFFALTCFSFSLQPVAPAVTSARHVSGATPVGSTYTRIYAILTFE